MQVEILPQIVRANVRFFCAIYLEIRIDKWYNTQEFSLLYAAKRCIYHIMPIMWCLFVSQIIEG